MNDNHTVLVIGPMVWGRGPTLKEAKKVCAQQLGRRKKKEDKFLGFVAPQGAYVNEMGGINYNLDHGDFVFELGEV